MTVENLLIKFNESMKIEGLSSTTIESYLSDIKKYFVDNEITKSQIEIGFSEDSIISYFEDLIFKQDSNNNMMYKKTYLNKKFSSISKFLFYLADQKIISSNFLEKYDRKILFGPLNNNSKKMKYCDHIVVNNNSLSDLKKKLFNIIKLYE